MLKTLRAICACALVGAALATMPAAQATTITIINNDGPGEGFNDPTPVSPVGGNNGTTLGQQRLNVFQAAAGVWAARLSSSVTIRVGATFDPLTCSSTSAILGSAGPTEVFRNFSGAGVANTWYAKAEANALFGSDLDVSNVDITAQFNSSIGTTCSFPRTWYHGLDGNAGSQIDLMSVVIHEMGHGLGFLTFVTLSTGAKLSGFNDVFMLNLENHGASPSDYPSMTDAQRVTASTSTGNLHWVGANVRAASSTLTAGTVGDHVRMYAPSTQQSGSSVSHWDTVLTPNQVMEPSYTQPLHDPALEVKAFQDMGWTALAQNYTLTVSVSGSGTVTSSPAGINCGVTCSASFASGTSVTLTASPASGWTFTGWGGACSGTGSCVVTMNPSQTVSATFTQQSFTLTVSKSGSGTVTSSPAGINCGGTCSASFSSGTSVTLSATPAGGWSFSSWGGACSGSGSCVVTMNSAQSVSTTFLANTATALVSSANPNAVAGTLTFAATVTSGAGTPTGNVTFSDGGTPIGSGSLSGGVATLATSALAEGFHSITAAYGGGGSFSASASGALTQSIIYFSSKPRRRRF